MVVTQPDYYENFTCIAGDCPDSCCIGWQVVIDREHLEFYRTLEGETGNFIRQGIVNVDGEPSFALCNGRCCNLREDGLCKIQYALGETALSNVCGFYPRFVTELGLIREQGLSISCPEVARIVLTKAEPVSLKTYQTDDPLRYLHDVEPERLIALRQGRDRGISILQNRDLPLSRRMKDLLLLGIEIDALEEPNTVIPMSDEAFALFRHRLYELYLSLERLRPHWTQILETGRQSTPLRILNEDPCWEQLLVYYLFKYSLRSAMEENFIECIIMSILSVILLQELYSHRVGDLIYLVQLYAKETEHNDNNLETILHSVWEEPSFSPKSIMEVLNRFHST